MSVAPWTSSHREQEEQTERAALALALRRAAGRGDVVGWSSALAALVAAEQERLVEPMAPSELRGLADRFGREGLKGWMATARPGDGARPGSTGLLGAADVMGYLDGGAPAPAVSADVRRELRLAELAAWSTTRFDGHAPLPLVRLVESFELDPIEVGIVTLLWLSATDPFFRRACQIAQNDLTARPDVQLLSGILFGAPGPLWALARVRLHPDAPLRRAALVELDGIGLDATVRLADSVTALLDGCPMPGSDLGDACRWSPCGAGVEDGAVDEGFAAAVASALVEQGGAVAVVGPADYGRQEHAAAAAAALGRGTITVQLRRLRTPEVATTALTAALRDARLLDALVVVDLDGEEGGEGGSRGLIDAVARGLERHGDAALLCASVWTGEVVTAFPRTVVCPLPALGPERRLAMWSAAVEGAGLEVEASVVDEVARRTLLGREAIEAVVAEVGVRARLEGVGEVGRRLSEVAARKVEQGAGGLTRAVHHRVSWADVVLPDTTLEHLMEIVSFARYRDEVFERQGFGRKVQYGRGLTVLLHGEPGTGKTMVASLIARELGRPLLRVDLSEVTSKWIGETEKNLARVFDEAKRQDAVLLFDEADSLFGKRTEVKNSTDRYANMNVNFLLQAIEAFEGVVVLTTNLATSIDDAFARRIRFKVRFELPGAPERAQLWASMFPPEADVADDLDLDRLGAAYELSGGYIKEAVLRAAFVAAERACPIDHAMLEDAASRIYGELGRIVQR